MAKDSSVAPKERINVVYKPATGDNHDEVELPLKLMVTGDFSQKGDETPVEERKVVSVNKNNLNEVMNAQNLSLNFTVDSTLSEDSGDELPVELEFNNIRDFEPENVARQVPELQKLLELREALTTLKGPMGNVPKFRKLLQSIVEDEGSRDKLLQELDAISDPDET